VIPLDKEADSARLECAQNVVAVVAVVVVVDSCSHLPIQSNPDGGVDTVLLI